MSEPITDPELIAEFEAQEKGVVTDPDLVADFEQQERLRNGDYDLNTLAGAFQGAVGVTETVGQMVTGLVGAIPGTVYGVTEAVRQGDAFAFPGAFNATSEPFVYEARSVKGKKYTNAVSDIYTKVMDEKLHGYLTEKVADGGLSAEEAGAIRAGAEALLLAAPVLAGKGLSGIRSARKAKGKPNGETRNIYEDPFEAEVGGKPGLEGELITDPPVRRTAKSEKDGAILEGDYSVIVDDLVNQGYSRNQIVGAVDGAKTAEQGRARLQRVREGDGADSPAPNRGQSPPGGLPGRQSGNIDPRVFAEGFKRLGNTGYGLGHTILKNFAFKQISSVRNLPSPTAKMLADRIMPLENSKIPLGGGYFELVHLKQGEYNTRLNNVLDPVRGFAPSIGDLRVIGLNKSTNTSLLKALRTGEVPVELEIQARALRKILDDVQGYTVEAGLETGYIKNYVPRVYDTAKITRAELAGNEFTKFLQEEGGYSAEAAKNISAKIIREDGVPELAPDNTGRLTKDTDYSEWRRAKNVSGGPAKASFEKSRKVDIPDELLSKWLVNDVEALLNSYINRAVERTEYSRIAGQGEGKLNQIVGQIVDEAKLAGTKDSPHKIAQQVYDQFDALQHKLHFLENDAVRSFVRGANNYETVLHLGLVSLAQLPEFMSVGMQYRLNPKALGKAFLGGAKDAASAASVLMTGKRRIPKSELTQHLERIGVIAPMALESSTAARFSTTSGKFTHRFMRATLMEGVTNVQRMYAADTIRSMVHENIRALDKGTVRAAKKRMYEQELIELGIRPEEAIAWHKAGKPADHPFMDTMDLAIVRGSYTPVLEAHAGQRPIRFNDQRFSTVLLFKSFMASYGNTTVKRLLGKMTSKDWTTPRKMGAMSSAIASVGIAYYVQYLREAITGYAPRDIDDPKRMSDALDRSGLTGSATHLWSLYSPFRYGFTDSTSQRIFNLLGPLVGDVAKATDAAMSGDPEKQGKTAAKLTPIANMSDKTREEVAQMYEEIFDSLH